MPNSLADSRTSQQLQAQMLITPEIYERRERVFLVLAGLFLGTLTMLNILGISRFLVLASYDPQAGFCWGVAGKYTFAVAVGVLPYPITFLCTDLISELYGQKRANLLVWVGLLLNLWVIAILWAGGAMPGFAPNDPVTGYPPLPTWDSVSGHYIDGLGWTFYHIKTLAFGAVTASMIAYLLAQFVDVYLFHFWKRLTKGKHLWLRNNGSTMVSQIVDTVAVILITHFWAHALPLPPAGRTLTMHLMLFIVTGYAFKFIAALLDTPLIYLAVKYLGPYLQIDPTKEYLTSHQEANTV